MEGEIDNLVRCFENVLLDLFDGLRDLFLDELSEKGVSFRNDYSVANGYAAPPPLFDLDIKESAFPPVIGLENGSQSDNEGDGEKCDEAIAPTKTNYSTYYGGIVIKRVPRYNLGYRVLGRAFPHLRRIEIASDLYGREFDEVRAHEIMHVRHPEMSESEVRRMTREILPFAARFQ